MSENKASSSVVGYSTAIIQAVFYSMMGIFGRLMYATGLDAQQVMVLRFSCTVVFLGAVLIVWRKHKLISRQPAVYVQSIAFFLSAWTYLLAVEHMASAGLTTVIFYTYPAVVALLNIFFFHEKMSWRIAVALILSFIGIFFISGILDGGVSVSPLGLFFAVASCLLFAIYSVLIQKTARVDSSFTATFSLSAVSLVASLVLFAPELPTMLPLINGYNLLLASGLAIISTILPIVLYIVAVKHIGATKAAILGLSETPASLFFAWLILGEMLTMWQAIGAVCVIASILVVTLKFGTKKEEDAGEDAPASDNA